MSNNLHDGNFLLIDNLFGLIKLMLKINIEFYPLATSLDLNNKVTSIEDIKTTDYPSAEEMITRYEKKLNAKLKNNKIQSYCIAYGVITARDSDTEKTNAIAFKIKNNPAKEAEIFYHAYVLKSNKEFELIDAWVERNNVIK